LQQPPQQQQQCEGALMAIATTATNAMLEPLWRSPLPVSLVITLDAEAVEVSLFVDVVIVLLIVIVIVLHHSLYLHRRRRHAFPTWHSLLLQLDCFIKIQEVLLKLLILMTIRIASHHQKKQQQHQQQH
jgi:hypothetical protein